MVYRRQISTATLVMASATLLSRIAGLVRDVVIARIFGAGFASDAFFMAFTIPNLLRRFFGEGSLTAAFVPTFSEVFHKRGEEEASRLANRCVTFLLLVMLFVVGCGVVCSPWIVKLIGYGFSNTPGKLELTDQLNRLMFPYIGLVSILALLTGILNVRGHFFLPSLSPLFLNLTMILSIFSLRDQFSHPVYALACGVLIGGFVQLLLQYPALLKYKIRLRLDFRFRSDEQVMKIVRLMVPGLLGIAIYQINIVVTRLMASFLPDGGLSYLYYGQRLFEFPQGIFIVSLAQASLPMMSQQVAEGDEEGLRRSLGFSMTMITIFTVPAIVGLVLCSEAIYSLFFFSGAFDALAVERSALALICYAPGLAFVGYSRIAAQTFYALKDTRTPVIVSFWTLLVNLVAGLLLMNVFGFAGLAIALTLSSIFNAVVLVYLLQGRVGSFLSGSMLRPLLKILPACVLMAAAVEWILSRVDWAAVGGSADKSMILAFAVSAGLLIYLCVSYLFRVKEIEQGWNLLRKKNQF